MEWSGTNLRRYVTSNFTWLTYWKLPFCLIVWLQKSTVIFFHFLHVAFDGRSILYDCKRVSTNVPLPLLPELLRSPPENVRIHPIGNGFIISWYHPPEGQPTTKYLITYTLIALRGPFSKYHNSSTVPSSRTATILSNLDLTAGRVYTIIVTAVSDSSYRSSDPVTWECMCDGMHEGLEQTLYCCLVPHPCSSSEFMRTWVHVEHWVHTIIHSK